MSEVRCRFDLDTLLAVAGEKVFARGQSYHLGGQVEILDTDPARVMARVAGTDNYRTVLIGSGTAFDGECSCPAFSDRGFCKHMVATALAANEAGRNGANGEADTLTRIRDHLRARGVDALVSMIVDMAERDMTLFRRLDIAAAAACESDAVIESRFRKALDGATRTAGFVDYREAFAWAAEAEAVLDSLADQAQAGRAEVTLRLAEHAIARIEQSVEEIDDSDGHCGALLERARDIHLAAARAARPDPVSLARDLFDREMEDGYDTFYGAVSLYADVLGEEGLAEYRRLATERWNSLPARAGSVRSRHDFSGDYWRLQTMLDFFAERDGDVDARIAIRTKDLSSPWNYLQLAEFCQAHGRPAEALRWAEEGLWVFEDGRPDERLVVFTVNLLIAADRGEDAEEQLWRVFEKAPGLDLYKRLRTLGADEVRERAIGFLDERLAQEATTRWHFPADLLVLVMMEENMLDKAWATVHKHGASPRLRESLARASEASHPREALAVYGERVDELVEGGGNRNYEEATGLAARMAGLRDAQEQAVYIADLKARFRRKRNFMKMLG